MRKKSRPRHAENIPRPTCSRAVTSTAPKSCGQPRMIAPQRIKPDSCSGVTRNPADPPAAFRARIEPGSCKRGEVIWVGKNYYSYPLDPA